MRQDFIDIFKYIIIDFLRMHIVGIKPIPRKIVVMCLLFLCIVTQENIHVRMNIVKENISLLSLYTGTVIYFVPFILQIGH